jgi:hypothetical protein
VGGREGEEKGEAEMCLRDGRWVQCRSGGERGRHWGCDLGQVGAVPAQEYKHVGCYLHASSHTVCLHGVHAFPPATHASLKNTHLYRSSALLGQFSGWCPDWPHM